MTIFTVADAQAAAARLATEQQAIVESLMNLENHPGRRLLDSAAVAGVTRERRTDVLDCVATLWTLYETYQTAVLRVRTIMARPSPPDPAELRDVEKLVTGAAMVVAPSSDGSLLHRQVSLHELVGEIQSLYGRIHEVVTAADRVWAELSPRIDGCDAALGETRTRAAELGLVADQDPAVTALTELADRLDTVRRIALTDPLRLWVNGAVEVTEADQLISRCEGVHADLHTLGELRQQGQRRLDQVNATLREIDQLDQDISAERDRVHAKIQAPPGPEPTVQPADPLGPRLADAAQLYRHGHWRQLAVELPALERDAGTALQRAHTELAEAGQPVQQRAELRGWLSAYRAKAAALRTGESLALEQRYQQARDLLWCAPCDLAAAAAAVADYQDAVNTTGAMKTGAVKTVINGEGA